MWGEGRGGEGRGERVCVGVGGRCSKCVDVEGLICVWGEEGGRECVCLCVCVECGWSQGLE